MSLAQTLGDLDLSQAGFIVCTRTETFDLQPTLARSWHEEIQLSNPTGDTTDMMMWR